MPSRFLDYYRCPVEYEDFTMTGELSSGTGFFTFQNAVCFGRASGASPRPSIAGRLPEVGPPLDRTKKGRVPLPFELSEIVDNFRYERYHFHRPGAPENGRKSLTNAIYYFLRPVLPVELRKYLQRARLRGWEQIPFPRWPIDVTVDNLMQVSMALMLQSKEVARVPFIWFWPGGASSCAMMTHDVEALSGLNFCDELMNMDDDFGIKSSFQIVPEGRYERQDGFLERVRARGFEINVHDLNHDGRLFQSEEQFRRRAVQINAYGREFGSRGFRAGAMYREQQWFDALDFSYDMSVPNVAHLEPQRGGCCTLMPYFIDNLIELPLTAVQDYSLFHIIGDYSIELWKKQIALISARNGLISFIVHPDYLIEPRARAVYLKLLAHLREVRESQGVWFALPGDVERWWRSRSQMTLVRRGQSWHIEGANSDRARVAYARLDGDRLVYELAPPVGALWNEQCSN